MIRRSPCEYYLKYLVVHPEQYSNDRIREITNELQFDFVGKWYLDRLRATCIPPVPFYPSDPLHVPSQRFLMRERIQNLFLPNEDVRTAFKIVERPRLKEFVEAMVLAGAPDSAIARSLRENRNFPCTIQALERYRHYFWNTELVDSTDMRALLRLRVDAAGSSTDPEIQAQHGALQRAYYNDPRKVAAELPSTPVAAMFSQMRMGIMPGKLELVKVLEMSQAMSAGRALEAMMVAGPEDSSRAFNYANVLRIVTETLEHVAKPDEELQKTLSAITMKTEEKSVPTLSELTKGRHTAELEPLSTSKPEQKDGDLVGPGREETVEGREHGPER